jgi:hypothetical protein
VSGSLDKKKEKTVPSFIKQRWNIDGIFLPLVMLEKLEKVSEFVSPIKGEYSEIILMVKLWITTDLDMLEKVSESVSPIKGEYPESRI